MRGELDVLWHCPPLESSEHFTLRVREPGYRLQGRVILPIAGVPSTIHYDIDVDASWKTMRMHADITIGRTHRSFSVEVDRGIWSIDGEERTDLESCFDVDLGWTPATNSLPINRLALGVDGTAQIEAVWLRFPELTFERCVQTYTRLSEWAWSYQSGGFDAILEVTDEGVVTRYGDHLWRALAISR